MLYSGWKCINKPSEITKICTRVYTEYIYVKAYFILAVIIINPYSSLRSDVYWSEITYNYN